VYVQLPVFPAPHNRSVFDLNALILFGVLQLLDRRLCEFGIRKSGDHDLTTSPVLNPLRYELVRELLA
jgi:hypothetical protein